MKSKVSTLSDAALNQAADFLKVMAHPMRLKIVEFLMQGEFTVGQIADLVGLSPSQTCAHLRLLQTHNLLSSERRGHVVYYRITSPCLPGLIECIGRTCGK